jgi:hypothetical protein
MVFELPEWAVTGAKSSWLYLCGPLRISAVSALKALSNAEIRRGRRGDFK